VVVVVVVAAVSVAAVAAVAVAAVSVAAWAVAVWAVAAPELPQRPGSAECDRRRSSRSPIAYRPYSR
jgi:hypothetical protein